MEGKKKNLGLKTTKGSVYVCTANSHLAKRSLRISIRCCSMESKKGSALLSFTIFCTMLKTSPTSVLRVKDWYEKLKQCFIVNCSRVESIFSLWFHFFFIYLEATEEPVTSATADALCPVWFTLNRNRSFHFIFASTAIKDIPVHSWCHPACERTRSCLLLCAPWTPSAECQGPHFWSPSVATSLKKKGKMYKDEKQKGRKLRD